jgi:hypothetical protein
MQRTVQLTDCEEMKIIVNDIVGDTRQGSFLIKAIESYFEQKKMTTIIKPEANIEVSKFDTNLLRVVRTFEDDAQKALDRYTKKLNKENLKFRKNKKVHCSDEG